MSLKWNSPAHDWVQVEEVTYHKSKLDFLGISESDIEPYQTSSEKEAALVAASEVVERTWRGNELSKADIELLKVQDGRGVGLVSDWRDYRNDLRDWPEDDNFPNQHYRPTFKES